MVMLSGAAISNNRHYNQILTPERVETPTKFTVMGICLPVVFSTESNHAGQLHQSREPG